jgi:1-acyl-sn-glycerol-3-phosphate acyltransferase
MDALIIASITNKRIGFVANAGIFSNKLLASVFNYFHVIPIYRKKDVLPGEKLDNNEAFRRCHQYLSAGNILLIFPEGTSYYELKLREIKTGTARIALSYEALNNFKGDLKILPVALDYSDSIQFRSMISVTISKPILIDEYKERYKTDEVACVKEVTELIKQTLAEHLPHAEEKEQEDFLVKAHKFYSTFYEPGADLYVNPKRSLELRNQLSKAIHHVQQVDQKLYHNIEENVQLFFSFLQSENLTTGFFTDEFIKKPKTGVFLVYIMKFILLLPLYLIGLATNYLPYILPSKIFKLTGLAIGYKTSVQMFAGLITFPGFYLLELWLFRTYVNNEFQYLALLPFLFILTGYVAMYYWAELKRFVRVLRYYFLVGSENKRKIVELRDEILNAIEIARTSISVQQNE